MIRLLLGRFGLAVLAVVAMPAAGPAQTATLAGMTASTTDTTVDPSVAREIEIARARGVPAEPLLAKVREGRLKRAATPRIRTAVIALAARLETAREALGPMSSADELVAGADALAAGADPSAVRAVRAASLGRPASAPLGALAQLVASGVPSSRAMALIVDLLRRNATAAQVVAFGNSVETDAAGGLPAEESARFRWREFGTSTTQATTLGADASVPGGLVNQGGGVNTGSAPSSPPTKTPRRRP